MRAGAERRRTALVAAVLTALLLSACGNGSGAVSQDDYYDVLYDDDATAAEIIEVAGAPFDIARSGDGSLLLSFSIRDTEGGEMEKGAWRLLDAEGQVVRSETIATYGEPHGLDNGFVLVAGESDSPPTRIAADGSTSSAGKTRPFVPVKAGDVLISDIEPALFYRPSDGTVHEMPRPPGARSSDDIFQQLAIDDDGTVWGVTNWTDQTAPLVHSTDGGVTWKTEQVPMPGGDGGPHGLVASHGVTLLTFAELMAEPQGDDNIVAARIATGGVSREFAPGGLPMDRLHYPGIVVLPDGRLVIGENEVKNAAGWWIAASPDNEDFVRLELPAEVTTITSTGDVLYAFSWPGENDVVWESVDDGATWDQIDVGR
ncbi:sialidase family protein [Aeromicrobium sp. P5_D10]